MIISTQVTTTPGASIGYAIGAGGGGGSGQQESGGAGGSGRIEILYWA
jgi:hypothetical protein